MTHVEEDIDSIKARIADAAARRDAWKAAGREEKYLEAYFMVEALEQQLDDRLRRDAASIGR
jgi:hypothetical protein